MPDLLVRVASQEDLQKIYAIEAVSFSEPYPPLYLTMLLELASDLFLVVEQDGRIIGYAVALPRKYRVCHIVSIAVDPSFRGRGIGKVLLHSLIHVCCEYGLTSALLEVEHSNAAALRLYEESGFIKVGMAPHYYGEGRHAVIMAALAC